MEQQADRRLDGRAGAGSGEQPRQGLAALLRSATTSAHERAEGTPFVAALVEGELPLAGYVDLLTRLHGVYSALEAAAVTHRADPVGATVTPSGLDRRAAIENDLRVLAGETWRTPGPSPAGEAYAARVTRVAGDLGGWVAHAYTRYLGDLSGGRVLRGALQRHHGLPDDALRFYDFPELPKPKLFKEDYRARLDALPLGPEERTVVTAEACLAFDLNTALLDELGRQHLPARTPAPSR